MKRSVKTFHHSIGGGVITRLFTFRIPNIQQVSLKKEDMKDLPWSFISVDPVPCRVTIWVAYTLAQVSADWSGIGNAATYFVKWSIKVSRYLFFRGVIK